MKQGLQVRIGYSDFGTNIFIIDVRPGGVVHVAKPVELVFEPIDDPGHCPEPTLRLGMFQAENLLIELAEALSGHGVKTDSDAKHEGLLEATKYHLEDLRELQGLQERK